MTKELSYLSPAEILLVRSPNVQLNKLVRVTFLDLVLRDILKVTVSKNSSKNVRKNPTVQIGKSFHKYQPLAHEQLFLKVFKKDEKLSLKLINLLKTTFEEIRGTEEYKMKYIYTDERLGKYFKSNLFQRLLGLKSISDEGIHLQNVIEYELQRVDTAMNQGNLNVVDVLLALRGNILLLPEIPPNIFNALNQKVRDKKEFNDSFAWIGWNYEILYNHESSHFDIITMTDSEISSTIGSVDGFSFNNSDADGCSGCSGCGGCGGCGG